MTLTKAPNSNDRFLQWASQEGVAATADWIADGVNTAGNFELNTNGSLVCGCRAKGTNLLFTTVDLWSMSYIGGTLLYGFTQVGNKCGIISPHAYVVNDSAVFWMGHEGFYTYDGFVKPLPCDVQDYVFGSINRTYAHYIWAVEGPAYGEITWFYPHAAQTEITRYVTYNLRENHWVYGTLVRTAGVHAQPTGVVPVMCNASGTIFDHETGSSRNSEGTPTLQSGPIELGEGDRLLQIQSLLPDDKTVGDLSLYIYTAPNPDTAEVQNGPYTLTARTTLRLKARQVRVAFVEAVATTWRVGLIRLGVLPSSRR